MFHNKAIEMLTVVHCFRQLEADAKCRTFNREDSEGSLRNEEAEAEELAVSWLDVMKRFVDVSLSCINSQ